MCGIDAASAERAAGPRRIWRRILWTTLVVLLLLVCGVAARLYYVSQPRNVITIGPDTTVIDGPLAPDGLVDHVAALNQRLRVGVTPENNAAIPLLRAFGPGSIHEFYRTRFFAALGSPPPPPVGDYIIGPSPFAETRLMAEPDGRRYEQFMDVQLRECVSRPWTRDEFADVAAWLDANEAALERFTRGLQRSRFFCPLTDEAGSFDGLHAIFPQRQEMLDASRLLAARAMLHLADRDVDASWRDLESCYRFHRTVCDGTLLGWLASTAVESLVYGAENSFRGSELLTAEQARRCAVDLAALPPYPAVMDMFDGPERYETIRTLQDIARGDTSTTNLNVEMGAFRNAVIDWNACLRRVNRHYDEVVAALRLARYEDRLHRLREIDSQVNAERAAVPLSKSLLCDFLRNGSTAIGEKLALLAMGSAEKFHHVETRDIARFGLSRLGFGLAAYRANRGEYPASLAALAPDDLPSVPQDPFSGRDFVYKRVGDGYRLYSVGHNLTDDGGRDRKSEPPGDDITIGVSPVNPSGEPGPRPE